MRTLTVLVTGTGGGGIGEQIVKALRRSSLETKIICSDSKPISLGKVLGDNFEVLPSAFDRSYLSSLTDVIFKYGVQAIFPGSEPELLMLSRNREYFHSIGIFIPVNETSLIELCSDKKKFAEFSIAKGLFALTTIVLEHLSDLSQLNHFPYVLKPIKGSGSSGVFLVQDGKELKAMIDYLGMDKPLLIQEYVGDELNEYTIGVLVTEKHGYCGHIILNRDLSSGLSIRQKVVNRTLKDHLGKELVISSGISQGTFVQLELLDELVKRVVEVLNPKYPINIQCRVSEGRAYIFEINPRFSGTTNLRAIVGFNEPEAVLLSDFFNEISVLETQNWINRRVYRGTIEYEV